MGKLYDAKRQKLKEATEVRKKREEDEIVQQIKRKHSKENFNH